MVFAGLAFCAIPFLPGASGNISTIRFFWHFSPVWLFAFVAAAFFFRYRVVVRDETLTYGAFRRRAVPFSEVIDYDVLQGQRSAELWVYLKTGKAIKFSGMLSDFDEFVGLVNSHMAGLPGPQHDSAQKLRDQQKRKQDNKAVGWIMFAGLGIVGLMIFVLWRMQLLD